MLTVQYASIELRLFAQQLTDENPLVCLPHRWWCGGKRDRKREREREKALLKTLTWKEGVVYTRVVNVALV